MTSITAPARQFSGKTPFGDVLWRLVENEDDSIIRWTENGTAFEVVNIRRMEEEVLGKYFRTKNFTSLMRNLNLYSYKRTKSKLDRHIFKHPKFGKDIREQSWLITRPKSTQLSAQSRIKKEQSQNNGDKNSNQKAQRKSGQSRAGQSRARLPKRDAGARWHEESSATSPRSTNECHGHLHVSPMNGVAMRMEESGYLNSMCSGKRLHEDGSQEHSSQESPTKRRRRPVIRKHKLDYAKIELQSADANSPDMAVIVQLTAFARHALEQIDDHEQEYIEQRLSDKDYGDGDFEGSLSCVSSHSMREPLHPSWYNEFVDLAWCSTPVVETVS